MPAIDNCQPQIIRALAKQNWQVVVQPVPVRLDDKRMTFADLELRQQRTSQQVIIVEVKCFLQRRAELEDFYQGVGQYLFYRNALALENVHTPLYLAVPETIYHALFQKPSIQATLNDAKIKLLVINLVSEEIVSWID